jgi:hypothetical protein
MRSILAALALLTMASSAYAQSLSAPTYSVGDTWTVKTGNDTREVKGLKVGDGGTVDMLGFLSGCPTCMVQLDRNLAILAVLDGAGKPADPTKIDFVPLGAQWQFYNFPLEPKKRWEHCRLSAGQEREL